MISELGTMPPPPTPEEQLTRLRRYARDIMEIADVSEFDTDEDVLRRLARLRIMGAWPVPPQDAEIKYVRAFLVGVHTGAKEIVRERRSGGIA